VATLNEEKGSVTLSSTSRAYAPEPLTLSFLHSTQRMNLKSQAFCWTSRLLNVPKVLGHLKLDIKLQNLIRPRVENEVLSPQLHSLYLNNFVAHLIFRPS
jgi:hypothetical protein